MRGATFLLVINFVIGLSFATAFLGLSWRARLSLGLWCAAGFLAASGTVAVEAFALSIGSVRLVSGLSFSSLLLALSLIVIGIQRHYRPDFPVAPVLLLLVAATALQFGFGYGLPRDTLTHGLAYYGPFVLITALGAWLLLSSRRRRPADLALAAVLMLACLQFLVKVVAPLYAGDMAPDVRGYLTSVFAYYSQTIGSIISLLLGLAILGVLIAEIIAETTRTLQRDSLSGLLNRAAFLERVTETVGDLARGGRAWLVMLDLDHFKSINDRFGHGAGDEVIRAVGGELNRLAGQGVLAGRLGGEEFCLLFADMGEAEAVRRVEEVRLAISALGYALVPPEVHVTASFGLAPIGAGERFEGAMRNADLALYQAKAAGRDRFIVLSSDIAEPAVSLRSPKGFVS